MKKSLIVMVTAMFLSISFNSNAQGPLPGLPDCANNGMVHGLINSCQGFVVSNATFTPINYLVEPDPPYLAGNVNISLVPDCQPLEPCPQILKLLQLEVWVQNKNGLCLYRKVN